MFPFFLNSTWCSSPYPTYIIISWPLKPQEYPAVTKAMIFQAIYSDGSTTLKKNLGIILPDGMISSNGFETQPVVSASHCEVTLDVDFSCRCAAPCYYGSSHGAKVVFQSGKENYTWNTLIASGILCSLSGCVIDVRNKLGILKRNFSTTVSKWHSSALRQGKV